jgi:dTDP-4-dehydrorhamnose reductase
VRVAVSGASGRLGRALVAALEEAPFTGLAGPIGWTRADLELDRPETIPALLDRDRPEVVVHAAAWTDVDGCPEPDRDARNGGRRGLAAPAPTRPELS